MNKINEALEHLGQAFHLMGEACREFGAKTTIQTGSDLARAATNIAKTRADKLADAQAEGEEVSEEQAPKKRGRKPKSMPTESSNTVAENVPSTTKADAQSAPEAEVSAKPSLNSEPNTTKPNETGTSFATMNRDQKLDHLRGLLVDVSQSYGNDREKTLAFVRKYRGVSKVTELHDMELNDLKTDLDTYLKGMLF